MSEGSEDSIDELFEEVRSSDDIEIYTLICKRNGRVIATRKINEELFQELFTDPRKISIANKTSVTSNKHRHLANGGNGLSGDQDEDLFSSGSDSDTTIKVLDDRKLKVVMKASDEVSKNHAVLSYPDKQEDKCHDVKVKTIPVGLSDSGDATKVFIKSTTVTGVGQNNECTSHDNFKAHEIDELFSSQSDSELDRDNKSAVNKAGQFCLNGNNEREIGFVPYENKPSMTLSGETNFKIGSQEGAKCSSKPQSRPVVGNSDETTGDLMIVVDTDNLNYRDTGAAKRKKIKNYVLSGEDDELLDALPAEIEDGEILTDDEELNVESSNKNADLNVHTDRLSRENRKAVNLNTKRTLSLESNIGKKRKMANGRRMSDNIIGAFNGAKEGNENNGDILSEAEQSFSLLSAISDLPQDFIVIADEKLEETKLVNSEAKKKRGGRKKKKPKRNENKHPGKRKGLFNGREKGMDFRQGNLLKTKPCKYFLMGKCNLGDDCRFLHKGFKKQEACKFYKISSCSKGDDCFFMHGEFPCKFYHMSGHCRDEYCRFSHDPLTEETKALLEKDIAQSLEVKEFGVESSTSSNLDEVKTTVYTENLEQPSYPQSNEVVHEADLLPPLYLEM